MSIYAHRLDVVLHADAGSCAVMVSSDNNSGPRQCSRVPTAAAEVEYEHTGNVWLVSFCKRHCRGVPEARPLTDADQAELGRRLQAETAALSGQPWMPPKPIATRRRR